jgi:hypothetical protein
MTAMAASATAAYTAVRFLRGGAFSPEAKAGKEVCEADAETGALYELAVLVATESRLLSPKGFGGTRVSAISREQKKWERGDEAHSSFGLVLSHPFRQGQAQLYPSRVP